MSRVVISNIRARVHMSRAVLAQFSTSTPTPRSSMRSNGSSDKMPFSRYVLRMGPMSSRLNPKVICVRSLVPRLRNLAPTRTTRAALGVSTMAPTSNGTQFSPSSKTSA